MEGQEEKDQTNTPVSTEPLTEKELVEKHVVHTYADDVAKALDTTDASVVQDLLIEGREREEFEKEEIKIKKQKSWYKAGAIILILFTLGSLSYTVYHYINLTVEVEPSATVGVFSSTSSVIANNTDIRALISGLKTDTTLEKDKPYLVPLIKDQESMTLLSPSEIFSFFESQASEPLLASFSLIRLGVMSNGVENTPFIIGAVKDIDIASKELLIAEPELLKILYAPLGLDISNIKEEVGKTFSGEYMYNIPVRTFNYETQDGEKKSFFYARASDNIIVFTVSPEVLKSIYDSLIRQHR